MSFIPLWLRVYCCVHNSLFSLCRILTCAYVLRVVIRIYSYASLVQRCHHSIDVFPSRVVHVQLLSQRRHYTTKWYDYACTTRGHGGEEGLRIILCKRPVAIRLRCPSPARTAKADESSAASPSRNKRGVVFYFVPCHLDVKSDFPLRRFVVYHV